MVTLDDLAIDGKSTAMMVVDVVKDILEDRFRYDQIGWDRTLMRAMVHGPMRNAIARFKNKLTLIYVNSEYGRDQFKGDPYPIENFCVKGTQGAEFYLLDPADANHRYSKQHWSALLEQPYEKGKPTELTNWLRSKGIKSLIICGVTFTHCISKNIDHAVELGFDVVLPRDLVASRKDRMHGEDGHLANLKKYELHPRIRVVNSEGIYIRG